MTPEDNNTNLPERAPTRLERALSARDMHFPPPLKAEVEDALKAIAVEQGCNDSNEIDQFYVRFETTEKFGKRVFSINLFGYYNKPGKYKEIVDIVKNYVADRKKTEDQNRKPGEPPYPEIQYEEASDSRLVIECKEFKPLVDAIVKGFINKVAIDPEIRVDSDRMFEAHKAVQASWVSRTQNNGGEQGQGGGIGSGK